MIKKAFILSTIFNISHMYAMAPEDNLQKDLMSLQEALTTLYTELQNIGVQPAPPPPPRDPDKSIDAWQKKLATFTEFPSYANFPTSSAVTIANLVGKNGVFTQLAALTETNMNPFANWLALPDAKKPEITAKGKPPTKQTNAHINMYKLERSMGPYAFQPYVQKLLVPNDAEIAVFGDLHGSAHSLVRSLQKLKEIGFLNDKWDIQDPNKQYIIFLGDSVDSGGKYGIEVLYTIALLKLKNFDNVIFIRGNHEDPRENLSITNGVRWTFGKELESKLKLKLNNPFPPAATPPTPPVLPEDNAKKIFGVYNLLPIALFVGDKTAKNFILFSHGAPEIGYDPKGFLANTDAQKKYQLLGKIDRSQFATIIFPPNLWQVTTAQGATKDNYADLVTPFVNFQPTSPHRGNMRLGFIWGDFQVKPGPYQISYKYNQFNFNDQATQNLLSAWKGQNQHVHSIIRGHQHGPTDHPELWNAKGLLKSWNGLLYTMFSAPAMYTPEYPPEYTAPSAPLTPNDFIFPYDNFSVITIPEGDKPLGWIITQYTQNLDLKNQPNNSTPQGWISSDPQPFFTDTLGLD